MRRALPLLFTACAGMPVDEQRLEIAIEAAAAAIPLCIEARRDPAALDACRSRLIEASINVLIDEHEAYTDEP